MSSAIDLVVEVVWWVLLLVGLFAQEPWLFGPAAFFLLYNRLGES